MEEQATQEDKVDRAEAGQGGTDRNRASQDGGEKDETGAILAPDPRHQRWALLALALLGSLAIWSLLYLVQELDAARSVSFKSARNGALMTLDVAATYFRWLAAFFGLFGAFLVLRGARIAQSRRYPPPGAWIVRPTRVQSGSRVYARAIFTVGVGIFLIVLAYWMPPWALAQLNHTLAGALQTPDLPPDAYLPTIE